MRPSIPTRNLARRRSVRREPADWRPATKTRLGSGSVLATPSGKKPPSSASSRGRRFRRSSSAAVLGSRSGSLGEPIWLAAGTIRPRAPRRVFSQQLGELDDVAELGRRAQLALADRPGVGIGHGDQPVGDLLARQPLTDLACDDAGAVGQLRPDAGRRRACAGRRDRGPERAGARPAGAPRGPSARPARRPRRSAAARSACPDRCAPPASG